jgi:hypothetical protein
MALAKPGDPLVTGMGIVVVDDDTKESRQVTLAEYNDRRKIPSLAVFRPAKELTQANMPEADVNDQIGIAAIVGLRVMGMSFDDIADMLKVPIDEINRIIGQQSAQVTFERIFRGIIAVGADNVQGRIASFADNAASVVITLMNDEATRADVRLKAAQDVLDRSGTNAENFFAADAGQTSQDDELRITFMGEGGASEKVSVSLKRK